MHILDSPDNFQIRIGSYARIRVSDRPITGSFDLFVLRRDYPQLPISLDDATPFFTVHGPTNCTPLMFESYGASHHGYRFFLDQQTSICVQFFKLGTNLTASEKLTGIKIPKAKIWNLYLASSCDNRILSSLEIQVVSIPRKKFREDLAAEDSSSKQKQFFESIESLTQYWPDCMFDLGFNLLDQINRAYWMGKNQFQ